MPTMVGKDRKPLHHAFPAWWYGPNGETQIFDREDDVPKGWHDHPSKHTSKKHVKDEQTALNNGQTGREVGTTPQTGAGGNLGTSPGDADELDTDGHKWSADLHATTRSKTGDGRWRMKVGVKRPAPAEGYPKETPSEKVNKRGSQPLDL